ncbi:hypothetical protein Pmani_035533 [Petrolisthes manimaculis]|uniref:Uncharacterized protein n=1 Tax=Petrolisthes manimaculis TaxID=1843537 RepID=A0AAE1TQE1_9EUCA|nr:hypothetical protein Pmani_035533 [Petrolisthes manimaculis]
MRQGAGPLPHSWAGRRAWRTDEYSALSCPAWLRPSGHTCLLPAPREYFMVDGNTPTSTITPTKSTTPVWLPFLKLVIAFEIEKIMLTVLEKRLVTSHSLLGGMPPPLPPARTVLQYAL